MYRYYKRVIKYCMVVLIKNHLYNVPHHLYTCLYPCVSITKNYNELYDIFENVVFPAHLFPSHPYSAIAYTMPRHMKTFWWAIYPFHPIFSCPFLFLYCLLAPSLHPFPSIPSNIVLLHEWNSKFNDRGKQPWRSINKETTFAIFNALTSI